MTAPLADYSHFAGKKLAIVEHMLHEPFYLGIRQAQAHGLEIWLLVGDRYWYTHGQPWQEHPLSVVDRVIDVDTSDPAAVLEVLTDSEGRPLVDGVASFSDYHTVVAATVARQLGMPGADPAALNAANQKHLLRELVGDRPYNIKHVLVAQESDLDAAVSTLGFPMIAKPPAEAISYGVRRVDDRAQLAEAFADLHQITASLRGQPRTGEVLLEQYVEGPEVSVETMTQAGQTVVYGVTSKDLFREPAYLECGHTFPVPLPDDERDALYAAVRETLTAIGYTHGPCHTEVRLTADGPRLIEANPRTPSSCMTMLVTDVTGRSPILDAWSLALGERLELEPVVTQGGAAVRMVYPPEAGELIEVQGVERASQVPGVSVFLHVHPGDRLWEREDNSSCVGFCYSAGPDREAARAAADQAAAHLRFPVKEVSHDAAAS
jgi:biotin carboxylase